MAEPIVQEGGFRRASKEDNRLYDAEGLLANRSIGPEKIREDAFPPTNAPENAQVVAPDYDRRTVADSGRDRRLARGDHGHYIVHVHRSETRYKGADDADGTDPITDIVCNQSLFSTDPQERTVIWLEDAAGIGFTPGRCLVFGEYSTDGGTTYSEPEFLGFAEPGVQMLHYRARDKWNFNTEFSPVATARYTVIPVNHDTKCRFKLVRSGYDGKVDRDFLPAASTTLKGVVELATSGENAADVVVQGNDSRLSDARIAHTIRETATDLAVQGVPDGSVLARVGATVVGRTAATGWTDPTGTATRTGFATGTVTTAALAEHVKALIDDLKSKGYLGA